ncbi:S41 family peptidase [Actinoallomurus acaciae]|uniref:S41 family peptidase n=1 Tax=Actinoallomurus acaciae TaxID=502577 RepID=A0ABV5Y8C1_9ACTN
MSQAPSTTPTSPPLKPTTITTLRQAYLCIFAHYYSGSTLDDRALLVPAFSALTRELQRRGLDQSVASMPALSGDRTADWAAFAAVYTRIEKRLPADPAVRQAIAAATMVGMVDSLNDDHARWQYGPLSQKGSLGFIVSGLQGGGLPDPAAASPMFVTRVKSGSPAETSGVRPGDEVISVNKVPPYINGTLQPGVLDWINSPKSPVTLRLHRPATGRTFTVTLTPPKSTGAGATPPTSSVSATLVDGDIAKVQMPAFASGAADQVLAAIAELRTKATLRGVILDLRGNGGGLGDELSKLLGAWVHGKAYTYFCDADSHCTPLYPDDTALVHLPLTVLTDRSCASACDTFAAAVRDLRLGTLIGTRTAGLVSGPMTQYELEDNSTLALPSAHALQANKEVIATIGVAPHYQEPLTADALSRGKDPAVAKAVALLHRTS